MLSLGANIASLAPTAVILGLALVIFTLIKPDQGLARAAAVVLALTMGWRYMAWRITETVPSFDRPLDAILGWAFLTLEAATLVSSTFSLFILSRTRGIPNSRGHRQVHLHHCSSPVCGWFFAEVLPSRGGSQHRRN